MASIDFPSSPVNGQVFNNYTYDSTVGVWRASTQATPGLPAGTIVQWPTATAPSNWVICDGSALSRTTYASLFAAIGTTYGVGDGSTTFNVPNLKGRVAVGLDGSQTEFDTLGETGGAKTHTLTTSEMPVHSHSPLYGYGSNRLDLGEGPNRNDIYGDPGPAQLLSNPGITTGNRYYADINTGSAGSGGAHNNLQPYIVLNYIIKTSAGATASDSELAIRVGSLEATDVSLSSRATAIESRNTSVDASWTAFTPTLYNATIGNGTVSFYYKKVGKTVFIRGRFSLGSTSAIGTLLDWSLPFAVSSNYGGLPSLGQATYYNGAIFYGTSVMIGGGGVVMRSIRYIRNAGDNIQNGEITPTQPFTWGNGCFWEVEFNYEAA